MKYYIIAGEASGDLHGSNLVKELFNLDPQAEIRCWGGDKMQAAGAKVVMHYRDLAFMGFVEVIKNLPAIFKNLKFCKKDIVAFAPHKIILIDYPGFNLRIARWAKGFNYKIIYYISPQVWAWKESRVKTIKACVDKMLVILPFEKDFYKKWNYEVDYVGHPLVEVVKGFQLTKPTEDITSDPRAGIIALLPGSRKQEILTKLPIMLHQATVFSEFKFIVAKAPGLPDSFYDELLAPYRNVAYVNDKTYALLAQSKAALVTSGTATLETALFGVPQVICYKGSKISYHIAKRLIKIKFIGLVNLIMNREVVKELIQDDLNNQRLEQELNSILYDLTRIGKIQNDYRELRDLLEAGGNASAKAAGIIYTLS